jgi:glycosyltransferase involved in cell wall biosynthesis
MRFSVLIPTHNRLELLKEAISTVRKQRFDDWEIVVGDNASAEGIEAYVNGLNDGRIRCIRSERFLPVTDSWNNVIEAARGEYIVMLGDDDGLAPGYFETIDETLRKWSDPEACYVGAVLYAHPGALPGVPDGFVRSYRNRSIYRGQAAPFELDEDARKLFVDQCMNFRVEYDLNMQFWVLSRRLVHRFADGRRFFDSPYPDYYASNIVMLVADRIVVVPVELAIIGISRRSYGFYYFNGKADEGDSMLNHKQTILTNEDVQADLLPGSSMNDAWLCALSSVATAMRASCPARPNVSRYRFLQCTKVFASVVRGGDAAHPLLAELEAKLSRDERAAWVEPFREELSSTPPDQMPRLARRWEARAESHPAVDMPELPVARANLPELFDALQRESASGLAC